MATALMNVLEVISDQHLASCLGVEGHRQALTPNLDGFAATGMRFTSAWCQNPICTPSRVCILSGQYCHNHGYYGLSGPTPYRLPTFLGHFRKRGYLTAGIGKLHTPNDPQDWLLPDLDYYGESYDYKNPEPDQKQSAYYSYLRSVGLTPRDDDSIALQELPGAQQHEARPSRLTFEHCVEGWCAREARRFIDASLEAGKPFCMQVSLPRPHQCYTPDPQFWDRYPPDLDLPLTLRQDPSHRPPHFRRQVERYWKSEGQYEPRGFEHVARRVWRGYLACITQVDHAFGLLVRHLEQRGVADRTIVIYHADHGAYSGTHGVPEKAPGICSAAVCRVPMIWRVPGLTPAASVSDALVENIDLAATLPGLCGLEPMDSTDGRDLAALLGGGDQPVRNAAFTENPWSKAVRWDRYRMVHYQPEMFAGEDVGELYDVTTDPDESCNLYYDRAHRDVAAHGRRLILEWLIRAHRVTTHWPAPTRTPGEGPQYPLAGDGKESHLLGPAASLRLGQTNYL